MRSRLQGIFASIFLGIAVRLLICNPCTAHAETPLYPSGACNTNSLQRFKLVSPSAGWTIMDKPLHSAVGNEYCTAHHLFWTDNNGKTWREITPRNMPGQIIGQVFFLDRSHGWILSWNVSSREKNPRFYLLSTENGGQQWRTLVLQPDMFKLIEDYDFPIQLFFLDAEHGWILWHWHMMNSSQDALLSTTDGGRTWRRLGLAPGSGPLQFISTRDGWMIGGSANPEGVGAPEDVELWMTHDGGKHWKPVPLAIPVPNESSGQRTALVALRFNTRRAGMVAARTESAVERPDATSLFVSGFTNDAGETWQFSEFKAHSATPSIGDKHVFWTVDRPSQPVVIQMENQQMPFALPAGVPSDGFFAAPDFFDNSGAWISYREGAQNLLIATTDGGKTSKVISPPATDQARLFH